jgi:hypothetical protein
MPGGPTQRRRRSIRESARDYAYPHRLNHLWHYTLRSSVPHRNDGSTCLLLPLGFIVAISLFMHGRTIAVEPYALAITFEGVSDLWFHRYDREPLLEVLANFLRHRPCGRNTAGASGSTLSGARIAAGAPAQQPDHKSAL